MLLRKNFKRDEAFVKVKNRLEASNLERRIRLIQHELEKQKGFIKREMGQIREFQQQCKRNSGDSVGIYLDLVLNSHFRSALASGFVALSEEDGTGSDMNVRNQNQTDTDADMRWEKSQQRVYTDPKVRVMSVMQGKSFRKLAVPPVNIRKSGKGSCSAHSLKIISETVTERHLNNGRRKSLLDETEASNSFEKDRMMSKYSTKQNHLSNFCARKDAGDGNGHKETDNHRTELPKIVTSSDSRQSRKIISVSGDKNETGRFDTSNKQNTSSDLHILSEEPTGTERISEENVRRTSPLLVPKQTIGSLKGCTHFKLPIINTNLKSHQNMAARNWKKGRTLNNREMTDIVARIASELKLESPSAFLENLGNLGLTDTIPGKTKHTMGKKPQDSTDLNDLHRPPNRLIQKGLFFPEHMSNSDISDDSKSQSSSADDRPYILYKGRKLRNYVKPQDRFRVDQVARTLRKQQLFLKLLKNRPDDLTKCSLRWDSALGDSDSLKLSQPARQKALERLVNENMSRTAQLLPESEHTELNSRVKAFMDSLGKNFL